MAELTWITKPEDPVGEPLCKRCKKVLDEAKENPSFGAVGTYAYPEDSMRSTLEEYHRSGHKKAMSGA